MLEGQDFDVLLEKFYNISVENMKGQTIAVFKQMQTGSEYERNPRACNGSPQQESTAEEKTVPRKLFLQI